ncbi:MAG: Hpt domain-containing protein, partial [Enterobacterales bacterium]|nr:Hpt domain-containing protein [Enterobacterales bacterium]
KEPAQLQSLFNSLTRIADTLSVLELPVPRDVIRQQTKNLQKSIDAGEMPDDSAIMDIAGALLFVDANLDTYGKDEVDDTVESSENIVKLGEQRSKDSQVDEATIALVGVARKNLQLAKDGMIGYIASSFNARELESIPKLLNEVLGAMKIIAFDDAAAVLQIAESYVVKRLQAVERTPEVRYLDALADIITSVDYYLESREEGNNKTIASILQSAQPSQDLLLEALERLESGIADEPQEPTQSIDQQVVDGSNVVPISQSSAEKEVDESLIDDEVLEIFLEEADEEVDVIEQTLPTWIGDTSNKDALVTIRRSFHTLKGSGRLVGASTIGELSWAIESVLNKVLEESINPDSSVCTLLNNALTKLPNLVKEFSDNIPHQGDDVDELIARAIHISKGLNLTDFEFKSSADSMEQEEQKQPQDSPLPKSFNDTASDEEPLDPVLLEIFVNEAQVHLKAVNQFIDNIPKSNRVAVSDALIRALHTLKGSAHMAKVDAIAKITGPLENYTRIIKANGERMESDAIQVLIDSSQFLSSVVDSLKDSKPIDSDTFTLLEQRVTQLVSYQIEQNEDGGQVQLRDQQLISIFLTEGNDILREVSSLLKELKDSPQNSSAREKMVNELHAFRRGSEMIGIQGIQNLASHCEAISRLEVVNHENQQEGLAYLEAGVESLNQMIGYLKTETDIKQPLALIEEMQSWMADVGKSGAPEDMDQELVELFVEEADELTESARELLNRWKDNLQNLDIINELRRVYHTFKGSSRMAGAMHIGDLAFSIEELFNTKINFGREISAPDLQLANLATDKIAEMVDELRNYRWPQAATEEIERLTLRLDPTAPVEVSEELANDKKDITQDSVSEQTDQSTSEEISFEIEGLNDEGLSQEALEQESPAQENTELPHFEELNADTGISEDDSQTEELSSLDLESTSNEPVEPVEPVEQVVKISVENEAEVIDNIEKIIEQSNRKENVSEAVVTEDTIAPSAPVVVSGNVYSVDLDEDGLEVLEIYLTEADELLITLDEGMNLWSEDQSNSDAIDTILRVLHTFKGGARLADLVVLGDLTHEIESYFEKINAGTLNVDASHVTHILQGYDVIESLIKEVGEKSQMTKPQDYFDKLEKIIAGKKLEEDKKPSKTSKKSKRQSKKVNLKTQPNQRRKKNRLILFLFKIVERMMLSVTLKIPLVIAYE